jgi:hypothetical protein
MVTENVAPAPLIGGCTKHDTMQPQSRSILYSSPDQRRHCAQMALNALFARYPYIGWRAPGCSQLAWAIEPSEQWRDLHSGLRAARLHCLFRFQWPKHVPMVDREEARAHIVGKHMQ